MDKVFEWSKEKNQKLIKERGISFEAIVSQVEAGYVVAIIPGRGRFKHQKQFLVEVGGYIYVVPYVEDAHRIFLKTIIPSRKMTKNFLSGGDRHEKIQT